MAIQLSTTIIMLTAQQRDADGQNGDTLPPFQPCFQMITCNREAFKMILDAVKLLSCIRASTSTEHSCF